MTDENTIELTAKETILIADDDIIDPRRYYPLQFFCKNYLVSGTSPVSAADNAHESYPKKYTSWASSGASDTSIGNKTLARIFVGNNLDRIRDPEYALEDYKNAFDAIMTSVYSGSFVCHKRRREFYMYYTTEVLPSGECTSVDTTVSLDFCDRGYHYFEISQEDLSIETLSKLLSLMTNISRGPPNPEMPLFTAGEFTMLTRGSNKDTIKLKLMPEVPIDQIRDTCSGFGLDSELNVLLNSKKFRH